MEPCITQEVQNFILFSWYFNFKIERTKTPENSRNAFLNNHLKVSITVLDIVHPQTYWYQYLGSDHSYFNNPEVIDKFEKPLLLLNTSGLFPKMSNYFKGKNIWEEVESHLPWIIKYGGE